MAKNRVRELRMKMKLTQAELAEHAGTSQQQIQRIETRGQAIRADLAVRIATALGKPPQDVFTGLRSISLSERDRRRARWSSEQSGSRPQVWRSVHLHLRGGYKSSIAVTDVVWAKLRDAVFTNKGEHVHPITSFEGEGRLFVLNLDHLLFASFLSFGEPYQPDQESMKPPLTAEVVMACEAVPIVLSVRADSQEFEVEGADPYLYQLQAAFFDAEYADMDWLVFFNEDGNHVFFRLADVALASVSLSAIRPNQKTT